MCLFAKQSATYKGRSLLSAPRTEPYVRHSRIRLPPRVCDSTTPGRASTSVDVPVRVAFRNAKSVGARDEVIFAAQ